MSQSITKIANPTHEVAMCINWCNVCLAHGVQLEGSTVRSQKQLFPFCFQAKASECEEIIPTIAANQSRFAV